MRKLILAAVVLGIAVSAHGAVGDYEMFSTSRNWSNKAADGGDHPQGVGWVNAGIDSQERMYKWRWQEGQVVDWDPDPILAWMGAYPAGTTFGLELQMMPSSMPTGWPAGVLPNQVRWPVKTLNLHESVDWVEGDGTTQNGFAWTKGTPAATNFYAQTYYTDADGLPGSFDEIPDLVNSIPWTDVNGYVCNTFQNSDNPGGGSPGLMLNTNGVYDQNQNGSIDPAEDTIVYLEVTDILNQVLTYVTVALDYDPTYPVGGPLPPVGNDLLTGTTNRGLLFGPMEYYDDFEGVWVAYEQVNFNFYTNDQNAAQWPYLKVEVLSQEEMPIVGDTQPDGCVDGLDYGNWSLHYLETGHAAWSAGGYTVGNFNEDDIVDGLDYGNWSLHYLEGCSAPGAEVPEPAVLSLLAVASLALIRRKRR